jgi:hypothetical protein
MTSSHDGWDWFDSAAGTLEDVAAEETDAELVRAFASCFRGSHGSRVLKHLRALTLERVLGPESHDNLLRYVEGQRQLVVYICTLVERANRWPSVTGISSDAQKRENEGEQP